MTLEKLNNFYTQGLRKYNIEDNKKFLFWLETIKKEGYNFLLDLKQMQDLINYISYWYEVKYPERELGEYDWVIDSQFQDINDISNTMTVRQLLYRLSKEQLSMIECGYRSEGWGNKPLYKNITPTLFEPIVIMEIDKKNINKEQKKNPSLFISANYYTGKVFLEQELKKYVDKELTLEELLINLTINYEDEFDLTQLRKNILNHSYDIKLRKKLLNLVAIKLICSKNTVPAIGHLRAQNFIKEFNEYLDLNLSIEEIDEIIVKNDSIEEDFEIDELITRDYNNQENKKTKIKTKNPIRFIKTMFKSK